MSDDVGFCMLFAKTLGISKDKDRKDRRMPRLAGIDLPESQKIDFSLTKIYGVGWALSRQILEKCRVDPEKRTKDLNEKELASLSKAIEEHEVEGDLRREIRQNIQRLKDIGTYRGVRHNKGLPVRGQRTKTNGRTKKGKRKTVGAFKKEALAKQTVQKAKEAKK
ncbi:MAG: 30S ribosomal protein S13 [Microgenomates group bacterium GW2011_GWA2_39_19]|nr:MAG: 30S ribosomal protein S13 [Microgenomates group bacterium GW2011_GWA2_39_19]